MRASANSGEVETQDAWGVSLAFWVCLLLAAGLYAAVALAPKLLTYLQLQAQYESNQRQLVSLEQQVETLERVVTAIETEPEFVAELARIDFDAALPGDERIAVEAGLQLGAFSDTVRDGTMTKAGDWSRFPLTAVAYDSAIRRTALGVAVLLAVVAFTFLQEPTAGRPNGKPVRERRYRKALSRRYGEP